jgi:hypothetical protein
MFARLMRWYGHGFSIALSIDNPLGLRRAATAAEKVGLVLDRRMIQYGASFERRPQLLWRAYAHMVCVFGIPAALIWRIRRAPWQVKAA